MWGHAEVRQRGGWKTGPGGGTKEMEGPAAVKMQTQRSGLWTQWEGRKERVRRVERWHGSIHTTVCRIDSHGNLLL